MSTNPVPKIEAYRFGSIIVDGITYRRDVILFPESVQRDWHRKESHLLALSDLETVLEDPPQVLIIGAGFFGSMKVPDEVLRELESRGIEPVVLRSKQACAAYNQQAEQARVALAIHLTC
ncbi:MAG TPA: hypothetical protein G4O08_05705 [Anaerolineae bacterium]|nr:hypothetical protein [Anaerolineae bacterium]